MYVDKNIRNTVRIFPEQGRYGFYRYDMNENPAGLPKDFVDSVLRQITPEFLATYPEPDAFLQKYAEHIGAKYENVIATNGSDQAIRYILETFGEKGKDVLTVAPSFEMYGVNCSILGLRHKTVHYGSDLTVSVDAIIRAIDADTRVIALVNPNNPVGDVYSAEDIERIAKKAEETDAVLVVDEAYHYFYGGTSIPYTLEHKNVIVLRTFSKLFSIAACRLGVIISSPQIIQYIKNAKLTFDVNAVALLFGSAILDRPALLESLVADEKAGKAYTIVCLREHGYSVIECMANFVLIRPKHPAKAIAERLKNEAHILVHTFGNELLREYLRVSVGSIESMEPFITAFLQLDGK